MKRVLVLFSLIAMYLLLSESAVGAASDPRALQLKYEPWSKTCLRKSDCFVGVAARGTCCPSGGGVAIILLQDKSPSLSANFGTTRALEGAISVQIDQGDPIIIAHSQCYALGCTGKLEIDSQFIERLRRARTIAVEATTTAHQKISLSFSLAGFAKAYDGPGAEPKAVELTSDEMKERLKRAEKEKPPQCEE